jgi:hypothetical protein
MPNFTISVTVTGLTGSLVVKDDKRDTLTFTSNGTKTFANSYPQGTSYGVSIVTQPTGQVCVLNNPFSDPIKENVVVTATCTTFLVSNLGPVYTTNTTGGTPVVNSPNNKFDAEVIPTLNLTHGVILGGFNNMGPFSNQV